jgi:hypothetical protein
MPHPPRCLLAIAWSVLLMSTVVGGEDAKSTPPAKTTAEIERLVKQGLRIKRSPN